MTCSNIAVVGDVVLDVGAVAADPAAPISRRAAEVEHLAAKKRTNKLLLR